MFLEFARIVPAVFYVPAVVNLFGSRFRMHEPALAQHIEHARHAAILVFRERHQYRTHAQHFFYVDEGLVERIVGIVELVHIQDGAHSRFAELLVGGNRLRLDTACCTHHKHCALDRRKRHIHFGTEIHVPRRVDKVEPGVLPLEMCDTAFNRNATFFFFGHVVHRGKALFDLSRPADFARRKQDAFGKSRLSGIDVRENRYVADRLRHILKSNKKGIPFRGIPFLNAVVLNYLRIFLDMLARSLAKSLPVFFFTFWLLRSGAFM